jgi:hypothetical protein
VGFSPYPINALGFSLKFNLILILRDSWTSFFKDTSWIDVSVSRRRAKRPGYNAVDTPLSMGVVHRISPVTGTRSDAWVEWWRSAQRGNPGALPPSDVSPASTPMVFHRWRKNKKEYMGTHIVHICVVCRSIACHVDLICGSNWSKEHVTH